jgi:hypothetical protein
MQSDGVCALGGTLHSEKGSNRLVSLDHLYAVPIEAQVLEEAVLLFLASASGHNFLLR